MHRWGFCFTVLSRLCVPFFGGGGGGGFCALLKCTFNLYSEWLAEMPWEMVPIPTVDSRRFSLRFFSGALRFDCYASFEDRLVRR
jgi:hypothetical protein